MIILKQIVYSLRSLISTPTFTIVAILSLGLALGANTLIFSLVKYILVHPLPIDNPDRIVTAWENDPARNLQISMVAPGNFADWRSQSQAFESLCAMRSWSVNIIGDVEPERVEGQIVTADFFRVLRTTPLYGRGFLPTEENPESERVVVISHALWQRRFNSDQATIGKTVNLNQNIYKIVGIMPPGFRFPPGNEFPDFWTPLRLDAKQLTERGKYTLEVMGRLKPGVTIDQARDQLNTIARRLQQDYPATNAGRGVTLISMIDVLAGPARPTLGILVVAVCLVLLISCANLASLLVARNISRQKDLAIRTALGCSRMRLMGELLIESLLLSLAGSLAGLAFAFVGLRLLVRDIPEYFISKSPVLSMIRVDGQSLLFAIALAVVTAIAFGLGTALRASRTDLSEVLKDHGRGATAGAHSRRMRNVLIVSEVALSFVLMVSTGLLVKSFLLLLQTGPGFRPDNLITMRVSLPSSKYKDQGQIRNFYQQLLDHVENLPGVRSASLVNYVPFGRGSESVMANSVDNPTVSRSWLDYREINHNYLETMKIPLQRGRAFNSADNVPNGPPVVIINEAAARWFWPGQEAIGKQLLVGDDTTPHEVVGVIGNVKHSELWIDNQMEIYIPHVQRPSREMNLIIQTDVNMADMASMVRAELKAIDPNQPVFFVRRISELINESLYPWRLLIRLLSGFSGLAMLITIIGIYGITAYFVSQRTHEIAVRMALGASASAVLKLILRQVVKLTVIGLVIGIAASFASTRLMAGILSGIKAADVTVFLLLAGVFIAVALVAGYLPAIKAIRLNPVEALRRE